MYKTIQRYCRYVFSSPMELQLTQCIRWLILTLQISGSLGQTSFSLTSPHQSNLVDIDKCRCNYTEILTDLPYIIQELGRDDRFEWTFQGKKGDRGADGPEGPPGSPGRYGKDGLKGNQGEPGLRGLPGTSLVYNAKGGFIGSEKGDTGNIGPRGAPGRKGERGEPGTQFTTQLKDGSYIQVKGYKGDRGSRGRKGSTGEPGPPGLSMHGQKGEKGEPALLPDIDLLKGAQGTRGPPGLPGSPGIGCNKRERRTRSDSVDENDSCRDRPIIIPMKGDKGDRGRPGLSLVGEKGEIGLPGPPGPPGNIPKDFTGTLIFNTLREMLSHKSQIGSIGYLLGEDRAFIKIDKGWRELSLGRFLAEEWNELVGVIEVGAYNKDRSHTHYRYEDDPTPSSQRKQSFSEKPRIKYTKKRPTTKRFRNYRSGAATAEE